MSLINIAKDDNKPLYIDAAEVTMVNFSHDEREGAPCVTFLTTQDIKIGPFGLQE